VFSRPAGNEGSESGGATTLPSVDSRSLILLYWKNRLYADRGFDLEGIVSGVIILGRR